MADNTVIPAGAGGDTIAGDDIGGVKHQRVKVQHGADGSATDVSAASPLPVDSELPAAAALADGAANPTSPMVGAGGMVFNGTTWDRAHGVSNSDGGGGAGVAGVGPMASDGTNFRYLLTAMGGGDAGDGRRTLLTHPVLYNGTTYDRARSTQGDGVPGPGYAAVTPHIIDPATGTFWRPSNSTRDAEDPRRIQAAGNYLFNGTTHDLQRGNTEGTLLASAARTADTSSAAQTNHNARGVIVSFKVTTAGTGTLTPTVYGVDSVTGEWGVQAIGPAATGTGVWNLAIYPGAAMSAAGLSAAVWAPLPRSWGFYVDHSDASSWTYVAGYSLIT